MNRKKKIALVTEYDPGSENHRATINAVEHVRIRDGADVDAVWVSTRDIKEEKANFDGFWFTTGVYECPDDVIDTVRYAREHGIPTLGTCGGFQHVILELARNVLHIADAAHQEYEPESSALVVSRLACSLRGREMNVRLNADTRARALYGKETTLEKYYCNFGVSPEYAAAFERSSVVISGSDDEGIVRIVELRDHPFFMATLFVPQAGSTLDHPHPVTAGFLRAVVETTVAS